MPRTKGKGRRKSKRTKLPGKKKKTMKIRRTYEGTDFWDRPVIHPFGGHLINPPENCPRVTKHPEQDVLWADNTYCAGFCRYAYDTEKGDNSCERHRWFVKATNKQRAQEWLQWRVAAFSFPPYNQNNTRIRTKFPRKKKR